MLFELEFNKIIAELWRNMHSNIGEGKARPSPKFHPATEEFIRAPGAAQTLMEDFDATYRLIYSMRDFASSTDFAVKLWQIIIDVNAADLISVISPFETSMLISMLKYLAVFQLGTKLYMLDDIAAYITKIIQYIFNIVIYARDGTSDSLTPELTLTLMMCITLTSNYFKLALDRKTVVSYHELIQDLYEQNKSSPLFRKETEARMLCRSILSCKTKESTERCLKRLDELDKEGIMSPNLHFHLNNHLAFHVLRKQGHLSEAHKAIQKAEYFVNWHLQQLPQDKQPALQNFYLTRLLAVHTEILFRLGNIESALQRVGQLYTAFSQLTAPFRRVCTLNCNFFLISMKNRGSFLCADYLALLLNPSALVNYGLSPALATSTVSQVQSYATTTEDANELTTEIIESSDIIENSYSSPQDDTMTFDMLSLNASDESPDTACAFSSLDQFLESCQTSQSENVRVVQNVEHDPFNYVDYYLA